MSNSKRIRVVQFLNSRVRAGAEEVALELARGLDPNHFQSYVVCPQELIHAYAQDWKMIGVVPVSLSLDKPWQWTRAREFIRLLRREEIDIVHAHMICAALASVPLARLAGTPVVLHTCHGREAWRTSWLSRRYWVDRRIAAWTAMTVAVSESAAAYLAEVKRINPKRIEVIRNGRSMNQFERASLVVEDRLRRDLGIVDGETLIGVFGRLEEQKGHRYLLEALPEVLEVHPSCKVIFIGEGSLRKTLEESVQAKGLARYVLFTGYRADCTQVMSICDLIILPSLFEGLPLVPIEAAALGKPVVATAVDGTREVIADGITGVLVPPAQSPALAKAVIGLVGDRPRMHALGMQARQRAEHLFSLERQLRETEALYVRLLGKSFLQTREAAAA